MRPTEFPFFDRMLRRIRPSLKPIKFPTTGFETVSKDVILEEESLYDFEENTFFPVEIGDILDKKYQVLGKLGWGVTATVWLVRDLPSRDYLTLKICRHGVTRSEMDVFDYIRLHANKCDPTFAAGHAHLRTALTTFVLTQGSGTDEKRFHVLVQKPLLRTWTTLLAELPCNQFTPAQLKRGIRDVLLALDVLHVQCAYIHTDIKEANILTGYPDKRACSAFVRAELQSPSARKVVGKDSVPVYRSRTFPMAPPNAKEAAVSYHPAVLGDLQSAENGNVVNEDLVQPVCYRAPEVNFGMAWSYPVDIWNLGVLVYQLVDGHCLFAVSSGEEKQIRRHLAEVVGMLGPPPRDLVQRTKKRRDLFLEDGAWNGGFAIPRSDRLNLDKAGRRLDEDDRVKYVAFLKSMLQWRAEDRKTARELLNDPWLAVGDA